MIKIKSPAVSEAGNRCAGRSETKEKPGKLREKRDAGEKENVLFFLRELFHGGVPS